MYNITHSKTVAEATDKLCKHLGNSVQPCTKENLSELQRETLGEYLDWLKQYQDELKLGLENLYVNTENNNLYILEMADDYDDNVEFYYFEIESLAVLYRDTLGNLYYDNGIVENDTHQLILVEEDEGHYIYTQETWYEDEDRLNLYYTKKYIDSVKVG